MPPVVLVRALEPFPTSVRMLDALHLATLDYLRSQGVEIQLASYDARMIDAARRMSVRIAELPPV